MTLGKAVLVREITPPTHGHGAWILRQAVYQLDPPFKTEDWDGDEKLIKRVLVSAADVPSSGIETYIFPMSDDGTGLGDVSSWGELEGSFHGGSDHAHALGAMGDGYEIVSEG